MGKETLGRYEIVGDLAEYRVGKVIKATDPKTKQTVALKTFRLDATEGHDQELLKRFRTEAEEARVLSSPNIVTMVGTGEDKGVFFAVMEFVDGIRIFDMILSKKEISTNDIVDISRQVGLALEHAASKKIVHRNFKPGNVMVEWDGSVKIMDYGVPAGIEVGAPANGAMPQLLYYMSPEQVQRAPMDVRSNIYSWGAMLYELIGGKKAAPGETKEEICKNIVSEMPPPLLHHVPGVPVGINHVVMKALAKNPSERYQTGSELINDIENYKQFGKPSVPVTGDTTRIQVNAAAPAVAGSSNSAVPNVPRPTVPPPIRVVGPVSAYAASPVTPEMTVARPAALAAPSGVGGYNPVPGVTPIPLASQSSGAPAAVATEPEPIPGTVAAQQPKPEAKVVHPLIVAAPRNKPMLDSTVRISAPTMPVERSNTSAPLTTPATRTVPQASKPKPKAKKSGFDLADRKNQMIAGGAVLVLLLLAVFVGLQFGHSHEDVIQPAAGNTLPVQQPEPVVTAPAQLPEQSPEALAAEQDKSEPEVVFNKKDRKKRTPVKPVVASAPIATTGQLSINSVPAGAQIQIDGRTDPSWVTPYEVTVAAGPHSIVVSKPGFGSQSENLDVVASNRAVVSLRLTEMLGIAAVNSDPAGASIYIDGRDSGKVTPAQVSVSKGTHTLAVKRLGYFDASESVELAAGQTVHYSPSLKMMGDANEVHSANKLGKLFGGGSHDMGTLKIKTSTRGAQITINNRVMDRATPADFAVPPGNYEVILTAPGYKPLRKMISLQSGDRLNLDEVLER